MERRNYFKAQHKQTLEQATKVPNSQETSDDYFKWVLSGKDGLLSLGVSKNKRVTVSQHERENHFWVLGSTGEGKSKFLEYLICRDIDRLHADRKVPKDERRSCSLCFIDPTPQGKVAHKVLNYCAKIGFTKVFLVDPYQIRNGWRIPPINPLNYDFSHINTSIDYIKDAFRVLFQVEDESKTSIIITYLESVLFLLHIGGFTLSDLIYFTLPVDKDIIYTLKFAEQRDKIIKTVEERLRDKEFPSVYREIAETHLAQVELGYKNILNYRGETASTARRLNQLVRNPWLKLIFGHKNGADFDKLVSEGYVILVNASSGEGVGTLPSRLLATIIINNIIFTLERMIRNGFNKPYYLYLDEASRYATDKLVEVLDVMRNIKLRLIISNQYPGQLQRRGIFDSVASNAKTKVAFFIAHPKERRVVADMAYWGDLNVDEALSQQEQRQAIMKIGKKDAVIARTHDQPDYPSNQDYLTKLLATNNYASVSEVNQNRYERFSGQNNVRAERTAKSDNRTTRKPDKRQTGHSPKDAETNAGEKARSPKGAPKFKAVWEDVFVEKDGLEGGSPQGAELQTRSEDQ